MVAWEFSIHALSKMMGRGVSRAEVQQAVLRGMKFGPDKHGNFHARKGYVEAVYRRKGNCIRIITVMVI